MHARCGANFIDEGTQAHGWGALPVSTQAASGRRTLGRLTQLTQPNSSASSRIDWIHRLEQIVFLDAVREAPVVLHQVRMQRLQLRPGQPLWARHLGEVVPHLLRGRPRSPGTAPSCGPGGAPGARRRSPAPAPSDPAPGPRSARARWPSHVLQGPTVGHGIGWRARGRGGRPRLPPSPPERSLPTHGREPREVAVLTHHDEAVLDGQRGQVQVRRESARRAALGCERREHQVMP